MHSRYPRNGHDGCFRKRFNSQFPWSVRPSPIFQFASWLIRETKKRLSLLWEVKLKFTTREHNWEQTPYLQRLERPGKPTRKWERSPSRIGAPTTSLLRLKGTFTLMYIIMIAMRDWNVPVRTCRIKRYQQIVNSTFRKVSYLGGDAH